MASTWSALKIELLETGANAGSWGTLTNANLGDAVLGEAITGQATVDFASDADVTITLTDTATTQAARNLRLNITESSTGVGSVRNLILGSGCQIEKFYLINNTGTGAKTIKNTSGTGISVPAGKATLVYNNGTNVVDAASYFTSLTLGSALPVASGGTGTATPALVQGTGVTITGSWPNQTINATGTGGTVTSVSGTGTVNGLTLTGTVTTSGSLTLGGTLSGTASININGTVGATTANTGAFTTLTSTGSYVQTSSEANVSLTTTGQKSYALISGGGGNLSNGYFAIRNNTNSNNPFYIDPSAPANCVYISSTGLVVTGTLSATGEISTPSGVVGTTTTGSVYIAGGSSANNGAGILLNGGSHPFDPNVMLFRSAGTERVRIDSSGNVGIGTSSPSFPLNVQANASGYALALKGRNAGGNEGWLQWTNFAGTVQAGIYATSDSLVFANTSSQTERFRLGPAGQFGIGGATYGTSGQVLTSGGSGAAPTWASPAGGGSLIFLSSVTASSSATVDLETTFNSTYDQYLITVSALLPATNNVDFQAQFKQGGSYRTAGYKFHTSYLRSTDSAYNAVVGESASQIRLAPNMSSSFVSNYQFVVAQPTVADMPRIYGDGTSFFATNGTIARNLTMGFQADTSGAIQGVRFKMSSGNVASGVFRLYGIKNS